MHQHEDHDGSDDLSIEPDDRTGVSPTLVAFVVIGVLTLVFILQNTRRTTVRFLFFDPVLRVWTAILVSVALGVVLDRLLMAWWRRRKD
ncbi:hypothetical protein BH24ACT5_BH24ACT5_32230 [soil metagenome]